MSDLFIKRDYTSREKIIAPEDKNHVESYRLLKTKSVTKDLFRNILQTPMRADKQRNKVPGSINEYLKNPTIKLRTEKSRQSHITDSLNTKRGDYQETQQKLREQWRILFTKESNFKEVFLKFNEFVKENTEKRSREEQKIIALRELYASRDKVTKDFHLKIERLSNIIKFIKQKILKYAIYDKYLDAVLELDSSFKTREDLMNRFNDLAEANRSIWKNLEDLSQTVYSSRMNFTSRVSVYNMDFFTQIHNFNNITHKYYEIHEKVTAMELIVEQIVVKSIVIEGYAGAAKDSLNQLICYLKQRQKTDSFKIKPKLNNTRNKCNYLDKSLATVMALVKALSDITNKVQVPKKDKLHKKMVQLLIQSTEPKTNQFTPKTKKIKELAKEPQKPFNTAAMLTGIQDYQARYQKVLQDMVDEKLTDQSTKYRVGEEQLKLLQARFGETNKELFDKIQSIVTTITGRKKKIDGDRHTSGTSSDGHDSSFSAEDLSTFHGSVGGPHGTMVSCSVAPKTQNLTEPPYKSKSIGGKKSVCMPEVPPTLIPYQSSKSDDFKTGSETIVQDFDTGTYDLSGIHTRTSVIRSEINVDRQFQYFHDKTKSTNEKLSLPLLERNKKKQIKSVKSVPANMQI